MTRTPRPPCGTPAGYRWHYKLGEARCQPCKDAIAEYQRKRKAGEPVPSSIRVLDPCGTKAAMKRHRRAHEPLDDACREVEREVYRRRYARSRSRAANPLPEQLEERS